MVVQNPHAPSKQCIFPLVHGQNTISFTTLNDAHPGNNAAGEHNCVSFSLLDDSDLDVPQSYAMNKEKTYVFDATIKLYTCAQKKTYGGTPKTCGELNTAVYGAGGILGASGAANCYGTGRSHTMCDADTVIVQYTDEDGVLQSNPADEHLTDSDLLSIALLTGGAEVDDIICQESFKFSSSYDDARGEQVEPFSFQGAIDTADNSLYFTEYSKTFNRAREEQQIDLTDGNDLTTDKGDLFLQYRIQAADVKADHCSLPLQNANGDVGKSARFFDNLAALGRRHDAKIDWKHLLDAQNAGTSSDGDEGCLGRSWTGVNADAFACDDSAAAGSGQCNLYQYNPKSLFVNRLSVFGLKVDPRKVSKDWSYSYYNITGTAKVYSSATGPVNAIGEHDHATAGDILTDVTGDATEACFEDATCKALYTWEDADGDYLIHDGAWFMAGTVQGSDLPAGACSENWCLVELIMTIASNPDNIYLTGTDKRRMLRSTARQLEAAGYRVRASTGDTVEVSTTMRGYRVQSGDDDETTDPPTDPPTDAPASSTTTEAPTEEAPAEKVQLTTFQSVMLAFAGISLLILTLAFLIRKTMQVASKDDKEGGFKNALTSAARPQKVRFKKLHAAY